MATRLEKIKLSGFKSFVDPTSIVFPSNLIGVVGPNGCGKSNVIDAVRWVMGELSAKQLRGESSTDVIFNGSRDRKPVGQASIELVFDNSDSTLGGAQFASYSQIAIRREVSRDGQSNYYLNGTKCRRRDITDVFSGTGLGSRSYAIIEQDMISRFIEAKPEELRVYLEEVAGISKYKERRRETETRIRNTRDNLSRVDDLCKELATQLERLQRQAKAAERYKVLKEEERVQKAQQLGLRWLSLDKEIGDFTTVLHERENILEARRADLQHIDTQIEKSQTVKTEFNDDYQEIQSQYYEMGSNISRIEQTIEHHKDRHNQLEMDLQQLEENWKESQTNLTADEAKLVELNQKLSDLEPQLETIRKKAEASVQALHQAEENMQVWQAEWDEFNQKASDVARTAEVQQARIQHLEQQQTHANQRLSKIDQEKSHLSHSDSIQTDLDQLIETVEQSRQVADEKRIKLTALISKIDEQRATRQEISGQLDSMKHDLQQKRETQVSLEAVQALALGQKDDNVSIWLEQQQLTHKPRLAQQLEVEKGWEKAVEIVLGPYLEAICADHLEITDDLFGALEQGTVTVIDLHAKINSVTHSSSRLSDKVRAHANVQHWLQSVYVADTIDDALSLRPRLSEHESVVTKEGLLMGANWLRVSKGEYKTAGVIEREQELRDIKHAMIAQKTLIEQAAQSLASNETVLTQLEQQRTDLKDALSEAEANYAGLNAKLQMMQAQIERLSQHHARLNEEYNEQHHQIETSVAALVDARQLWAQATADMEKYTEIREGLLKRRDENRHHVQMARTDAERDQHQLHDLQLHWETANTQVNALKQSIERIHHQVSGLQKRRDQLMTDLTEDDAPLEQLEQELDVALEKRAAIETALTAAKQKVDNIEAEIQLFIQQRHETEQTLEDARNALEEKRMHGQELKIRQTTLNEQLSASSFNLEQVIESLPEEATEAEWADRLEKTATRIGRLGAINLAAIEEYGQCEERKNYLDAQHADLEEALTTLQDAIRKIDRETRSRFKETFDKVNITFQALFPKIFGGGNAYLELTGDDLLDTGVALMARPPGKRISNIHLLSGGEKALTAMALVFSLFQLNPAPFCMLDEVDAPLDDVNVGRFCELVKEMSQQVQFIFISHNKNAIEMADHLMGVTMHEPGVSRIVSVDIAAAVSMAES